MSQVEVKVNKVLGIILLIQFIFCFIVAVLYGITLAANATYMLTYIAGSGLSIPVDSILMALTYIVLLNTMIPISLIVSI
jgi:hypothetical protein